VTPRERLAALLRNPDAWARQSHARDIMTARAVAGMQARGIALWRQATAKIVGAVASALASMDRTAAATTGFGAGVPAGVGQAIDHEVRQATASILRDITDGAGRIGRSESEWAAKAIAKVAGSRPQAPTYVPPSAGYLGERTETWFRKMLQDPAASAAKAWVQRGLAENLTTDEIIRGLRGTRKSKYTDGILSTKPVASIRALVRTSATEAAARAREGELRAHGVTHVVYVATLDTRVSRICASLDGQVFPIGSGPRPPQHPNCRSTVMPHGEDPETRASEDGPIRWQPATEWLEGADKETQDRVLGKRVGAAFRAGKLTVDQTIGPDMQPLTIEQLELAGLL